jgi:hypothetical protein
VNHTYDWIRNDSRVKGALPTAEQEAEDIQYHDPSVNTVRELCNGAKHLDLKGRALLSVRHKPRHWFERPFTSVRRSPRIPLDETETKFLVVIDGRSRDVLDVGQEALGRWRVFLRKYGLPVAP